MAMDDPCFTSGDVLVRDRIPSSQTVILQNWIAMEGFWVHAMRGYCVCMEPNLCLILPLLVVLLLLVVVVLLVQLTLIQLSQYLPGCCLPLLILLLLLTI